jgi:hypothetical protein
MSCALFLFLFVDSLGLFINVLASPGRANYYYKKDLDVKQSFRFFVFAQRAKVLRPA